MMTVAYFNTTQVPFDYPIKQNVRRKHASWRRAQSVNGADYRFISRLLKFIMLNQHQAITRPSPGGDHERDQHSLHARNDPDEAEARH